MLLSIALLTSAAQAQFTVEAESVLSAATDPMLLGGVGEPTVGVDSVTGDFGMFFSTPVIEPGCVEAFAVGHATSPDGINWTLRSTLVLEPSGSGAQACGAKAPAVVVDGDRWRLFFEALDSNGVRSMKAASFRAGEARRKRVMPTLAGVHHPSIAIRGTDWFLIGVDDNDDIVTATSSNGLSWVVDPGAILTRGVTNWSSEGLNTPALTCIDGPMFPWVLHFGGHSPNEAGWAYAVSDDRATWYLSPALEIWADPDPGWKSWDLVAAGPEFLAFFEEEDAAGLGQIGVASTGIWDPADVRGRVCSP